MLKLEHIFLKLLFLYKIYFFICLIFLNKYIADTKPQVRVVSNGNEAVCLTEICSFYFLDSSNFSKVTKSFLNNKTLTISIEPTLTDEIKSLRIYLGEYYCSPVTFVNVDTLVCVMETLIAGKYDLRVKTELGDLVNDVSITQIQVEIIVSNVSPSTVNLIFAFNKKINFLKNKKIL